MEHIRIDITDLPTSKYDDFVFIIGRFQALHRGHQALLMEARKRFPNKKCGVVSFTPDPRDYFAKEQTSKLLTYSERIEKFSELGVEMVIEFEFDEVFSQQSQADFIKVLKQLGILHVIHGEDFQFGHQMKGKVENREVFVPVSDIIVNQQKISSSRLINFLESGAIGQLNEQLGYPFFMRGTVITGEKRARTLGFPTANIEVDLEKKLPSEGVYATRTKIENQMFESVTHVGTSPTFGRQIKVVETHLFNYSGDLYGKTLEIQFFNKVRSVQKFENVEAVRAQIIKDITQIKHYFAQKS